MGMRRGQWSAGLSPRVRGKHFSTGGLASQKRSIPACAGETWREYGHVGRAMVYPRVCGGNDGGIYPDYVPRGLSPRVRGKPGRGRGRLSPGRSIPACAGETQRDSLRSRFWTVYPRVCGGNCIFPLLGVKGAGLSPRVRGKHTLATLATLATRSIPACAGETYLALGLKLALAVYPRVCGGNGVQRLGLQDKPGLSPRVRGKPTRASKAKVSPGSIPACAGETAAFLAAFLARRVYPRVCGGNGKSAALLICLLGLSPRVRGKPRRSWRRSWRGGSIPACAGETENPPPF